ncbi:MAG TPA: hypothetical protein VJ877_06395, partial [Bacteroidales bacterium]|nr:hypothetical protein [Bacteroidales bacterium]
MKKFITLIFVFVLTVFNLKAANDTIIVKSDSKFIERNLDSLTSIWYLENLDAREFDDSSSLEPVVEFPDSVYRERLSNIHSLVSLPYNKIVRNHIHVYTGKKRDKFRIMLGMRKYYFPMIEDIFDSYGLPTELK